MIPRNFRRYLATTVALALMGLSVAIFALEAAGVLPTTGVWRALVIPAYFPLLVSALIATSLSLPGSGLLLPVGIGVTLLPFLVVDWVRARRREPDSRAA